MLQNRTLERYIKDHEISQEVAGIRNSIFKAWSFRCRGQYRCKLGKIKNRENVNNRLLYHGTCKSSALEKQETTCSSKFNPETEYCSMVWLEISLYELGFFI